MKTPACLVLLLVLPACGFLENPWGTSDAGTSPISDAGAPLPTAVESDALSLMNARRAQGANCAGTVFGPTGPLALDPHLHNSAQAHSDDMAVHNYFAHDSQDGTNPFQRMQAAGFTGGTLGENIAAGQTSADEVVTAWMSDYGHCANIMNPAFTLVGVGYGLASTSTYKIYWTADYGGN